MILLVFLVTLGGAAFWGGSPLLAEVRDAPRSHSSADPAEDEDGMGFFGQGGQALIDRFREELAPQLDEMGQRLSDAREELGPALRALMDEIDDLSYYEAPERLDNGDILIRRKNDAPSIEVQPDGDAPDKDLPRNSLPGSPSPTMPEQDGAGEDGLRQNGIEL
ncbi:hypothetical protein ERN12_00435 [Rhodobacteraceae bacterium]|nr:hypothetical protein ERN12_00435 [Paracoccaceae bacterium]